MADNEFKDLLAKRLEKSKYDPEKQKPQVRNNRNKNYEVALMELRKDIEIIKDSQEEIKESIKETKKEILENLKENYVSKDQCSKLHYGSGVTIRDKIIWYLVGLGGTILTAVILKMVFKI